MPLQKLPGTFPTCFSTPPSAPQQGSSTCPQEQNVLLRDFYLSFGLKNHWVFFSPIKTKSNQVAVHLQQSIASYSKKSICSLHWSLSELRHLMQRASLIHSCFHKDHNDLSKQVPFPNERFTIMLRGPENTTTKYKLTLSKNNKIQNKFLVIMIEKKLKP